VDVLSSRLLHRTGTVAAFATAVVLGGSGLALGATTRDLNGPSVPTVPAALEQVVGPVQKLAPAPRPQVAPVIRGVTGKVTAIISGPTTSPSAPAQPPVTTPKTQPVVHTVSVRHPAPRAKVVTKTARRVSTREVAPSQAHDASFVQRTSPAVVPELAPVATGPLAGLPDAARHAVPTALVVAAAAILAALGAGHLGLWRSRRRLAL
jgi:hypothetical protein